MNMDPQPEKLDFDIPLFRKDGIEAKLRKLAKRAARKKLNPLTWQWGEPFQTEKKKYVDPCPAYPDGVKVTYIEWQKLHVNCTLLAYKGWRFIARIEHMPEAANDNGERRSDSGFINMLYAAPGEIVPAEYHEAGPDCDHCGHKRIRRDTFIVGHEDGRIKQVGSTCMSDFLGHDASGFLAAAEILSEIHGCCSIDPDTDYSDTEFGFKGYGRDGVNIQSTLRVAAACTVGRGGYVSKARAESVYPPVMSTGQAVREYILMVVRSRSDTEYRDNLVKPEWFTDTAQELADKTYKWLDELSETELDELGDYQRNLAVVMRAGYCPAKGIGILASGVYAYQRATEQAIDNARAAQSKHQGAKGQRIGLDGPMDCECIFTKGYEGSFGPGTIVKLVDASGNRYTWFASMAETELPFAVSDKGIDFTATIKAHDTDKYAGGCEVTMINRPTFDPQAIAKARKREQSRKLRQSE